MQLFREDKTKIAQGVEKKNNYVNRMFLLLLCKVVCILELAVCWNIFGILPKKVVVYTIKPVHLFRYT